MDKNCGELRGRDIGDVVTLHGWCRYIRAHKGKLFVDIADRYGITQVIFEKELKKRADELGREWVISITGKVRARGKGAINKEKATGEIEVLAHSFEVICKSKVPPFEIIEEKEKFLPAEDSRLKYRYLDLRRKKMIKNIEFRDALTKSIRKFFWGEGFLELETPNFVRDTYDASGSRTFIVPSRTNKGKFFSLPQSPQIYKQLCMVSGLDKYFQVARVFRDEDPREDRQIEFTQIDFEVSFKNEKYIQDLIERLVKSLFKKVLKKPLKTPFKHMDYYDALGNYGNDKPDMRFDYKIVNITDCFKDSDYNIIKRVIDGGGKVSAIAFGAKFGQKESKIDKNFMLELVEIAKNLGLKGLTWVYVKDSSIQSIPESIAVSLNEAGKRIISKTGAKEGDLIVIGADLSENVLLAAMSKLRRVVGIKMGGFKTEYAFLWVDHFPLFEKEEINGKLQPAHNPFVAPTEDTLKYIDLNPEKVIGKRYDLVLNGIEIAGGSIRINDAELQTKILRAIGLSDKEIENSLGFLVDALAHGAPIHGGAAIGLDRFVATLAGEDDIKEFILFPRNRKFESPLDNSPSEIAKERLMEDYGLNLSEHNHQNP